MTTNELLACLTSGASDYIQTAIITKNKADYQKLKKLFDEQLFEAKSFEDSDLDILTFDWQSLERDRNWWWQLQALPFLNWYANSFSLQSEEERARYLSLCLDATHNWLNQAKQNKASPLVWHDHAAAFRVRNLTNWLVFCHSSGLPLGEEPRAELLVSLIIEHLDWLQEDKHYSKHTNHGFDQAMIALTIASMFAGDEFETYRQKNRDRLKDEVTFAFTEEGVHKENSPGYQKFMLGRLKQLRTLAPLGEQEISQMSERYIEKAEAFLRAVTLPNGDLPMIGDTRGGDKGLPYEQEEQVDVLDYSSSGYVIVRGVVLEKDFHLVFKASHLSHYHRHDDDLSIHLYYNGKNLLGDGGLGSHNEKDKKRKALRSYLSHNAPYLVDGKAARKVDELDGVLPTVSFQDEEIVGKSFCYGSELTREIDISRLQDGKLTIRDSVDESSGQPFAVNFFSPEGLYEKNGNLLVSINGEKVLKITPLSRVDIKEKTVYLSEKFSEFTKVLAGTLISTVNGLQAIETEMDLNANAAQEALHEVSYRGFGPIKISEEIGWFFDNDYPGNICHHVMSLRWIGEVESFSVKARILRSFVTYHSSCEVEKSKYYLGRAADHTTSIRLNEMLQVLRDPACDQKLSDLVRGELKKNIRSCLKETYKEKNNHGLMVDKALLDLFVTDERLFDEYKGSIGFVAERLKNQISSIFDQDGYCKEHSISYQEYNLGVCIEIKSILEKAVDIFPKTILDELFEFISRIVKSSQVALGWFLKSDGRYIPVGDSSGIPKRKILRSAYGGHEPMSALLPYSLMEGVFHNETLGASIYRDKKIHLAFNACWHSYVHKQNDDLSLFLRLNDEDVFIDGGFSGVVDRSEVDTRSEYLHSTIIPKSRAWLKRGQVGKGFSKISTPEEECGSSIFRFFGKNGRVEGLDISRSLTIHAESKEILVSDKVSTCFPTCHRFIIPGYFEVKVKASTVEILSDLNRITLSLLNPKILKENEYWGCDVISCVAGDRVVEAQAIDFWSHGFADILMSFD